ncbi:MAG: Glu-tRNA(Gln) amidotransferase subunit GatE [Nanoarchaeota archaeon]
MSKKVPKDKKVLEEAEEKKVFDNDDLVLDMKCGIEIHQQLNTNKLFCNCPSVLRADNPDFKVMRKLHLVAGEGGVVDAAAVHESSKEKTFFYEGYKDNTCLVDLDEEPPHDINKDALKTGVQVALMLNCEILPLTQIMRKTVIDGSNTSGFQRTVLIARNGYVQTDSGKVRIDSVCLEEDSSRTISEDKGVKIYRLDRLGIPLVEIATAPDIKSPEQAKEVALFIGDILRSSNVKRGIGTIRQDVNVSACVNGLWGSRVEIKGVQDPSLIEKSASIEVDRQKTLILEGKSVGEVRKANEDGTSDFLRPMPGAARMYPETDLPLLRITREEINDSKKTLPKLKSAIKGELSSAGLSDEMIKLVLDNNKISDLQELLKVYQNPNLIAKMLVLWPSEISKKTNEKLDSLDKKLTLDVLETVLFAINTKKLDESNAKEAISRIVSGIPVKDAIIFHKTENLEELIMKIVNSKPGLSKQGYMGLVMAQLRGKASGKEVMDVLNTLIKD